MKKIDSFLMSSTQHEEEVLVAEDKDLGWRVILWNDDVNTFQWVINCLVEICSHDPNQAEQCSFIVHFKGKCQVKSGNLLKMQTICQALQERGLSATLESVE